MDATFAVMLRKGVETVTGTLGALWGIMRRDIETSYAGVAVRITAVCLNRRCQIIFASPVLA